MINQIQVNPRIDLTFAVALRFILPDPDIMVGEIRDPETENRRPGCLDRAPGLGDLHTNNAAGRSPA